jgi:hypothetical protein
MCPPPLSSVATFLHSPSLSGESVIGLLSHNPLPAFTHSLPTSYSLNPPAPNNSFSLLPLPSVAHDRPCACVYDSSFPSPLNSPASPPPRPVPSAHFFFFCVIEQEKKKKTFFFREGVSILSATSSPPPPSPRQTRLPRYGTVRAPSRSITKHPLRPPLSQHFGATGPSFCPVLFRRGGGEKAQLNGIRTAPIA